MGKPSAPTMNNSAVTNTQAAVDAAKTEYGVGADQTATNEAQAAANTPQTNAISLGQQGAQTAAITQGEGNYTTADSYAPITENYQNAVQNYDTPASEANNAGAAEATTAEQYSQARNAAQSQLEGYGVDPTSTRYAALDQQANTGQAAAAAGAGNKAIQDTRNNALTLDNQAINTGLSTQNAGTAAINSGTAAGSAAANTLNSSETANAAATTAPTAWYNSGATNMNTNVSAVNSYNQSQADMYKAQMSASSGIGSMLGSVAGLASNFMEDGGSVPAYADGGSTGAIPDTSPGGTIPTAASPSSGSAVDDVPANLTAGEFVIPKDAVKWMGEKAMYGIIDKARTERAEIEKASGVGPQLKQAIPGPPTFSSQAGQQRATAIPAHR